MRKLVVKGGAIEQEYPLIDTTIIGRASSSTIRLEGQKVADEHAKISKTGPNIFVEDLDTPHGITVNGKKVARWALRKGDLIGVGAITLLYDEDDKPDPPPKAKAPPVPETAKSAANLTPAKSSSAGGSGGNAVKNPGKETLPTAVKNGLGNGKSATTLPVVKSPDSVKAAEPKPAVPKPVEPKPAGQGAGTGSSNLISPAKNPPPVSSAKSSSLISAVAVPPNFNPGSSQSKINLAKENRGNSSPGMSAVGGNMLGAGNSKSGILSAAGGKIRPSLGGHLQVPGGASDSSSRISAASSAALMAQRSSQAHMTPVQSGGKLPKQQLLMIAVGVLCFLVLVLGAVLIVTLSRGNGPTSDEKAAILRLHAKGPKASDDLKLVTQKLRAAKHVSDVLDVLGEPDLKFTGEMPMWDPQTGTSKYYGTAFIAYYISDEGAPSAIEENPIANVMVFLVNDPKVEFIGPKKYARLPVGPANTPETTEANPASVDQPAGPTAAPPHGAPPGLPPPLPLPDGKPPVAPPPK